MNWLFVNPELDQVGQSAEVVKLIERRARVVEAEDFLVLVPSESRSSAYLETFARSGWVLGRRRAEWQGARVSVRVFVLTEEQFSEPSYRGVQGLHPLMVVLDGVSLKRVVWNELCEMVQQDGLLVAANSPATTWGVGSVAGVVAGGPGGAGAGVD